MAVQTITYSNKSNLNVNSQVPDINKINDTDMNQIKSVVNNNASILGGIEGTLLWTNSNPTNDFTPQTITLSSSNYDMLEIYYYDWKTGQNCQSVRVPKGEKGLMQSIIQNNGNAYAGVRGYVPNSDTQLYFGSCVSIINDSQIVVGERNNWCIPVYVIGYKTGLF